MKAGVHLEVFDYTPGIEALAEQSLAYTKKCLEEARKIVKG
jgi:hypothetical protein